MSFARTPRQTTMRERIRAGNSPGVKSVRPANLSSRAPLPGPRRHQTIGDRAANGCIRGRHLARPNEPLQANHLVCTHSSVRTTGGVSQSKPPASREGGAETLERADGTADAAGHAAKRSAPPLEAQYGANEHDQHRA